MAKKALTKVELEQKGKELAGLVMELEALQTKNKEKKKALKATETDLESQINELALQVDTGSIEISDQVDAFDDAPKPPKPNKLAAVEDEEQH